MVSQDGSFSQPNSVGDEAVDGDNTQGMVSNEFDLQSVRKRLKVLQSHHAAQHNPTDLPSGSAEGDQQPSRFAGRALESVLMVELFAGSGRLTKACQQAGFRGVAVDKTEQRAQGCKIFTCDVANEHDLEMLQSFLQAENHNLAWVHIAPACGTASRAREKPNRTLERAGFKVPKPCRSDEFPLGLPTLSGLDKVRTDAANQAYEVTANLVRFLVKCGVVCTIENPTNSLFWNYDLKPFVRHMRFEFNTQLPQIRLKVK